MAGALARSEVDGKWQRNGWIALKAFGAVALEQEIGSACATLGVARDRKRLKVDGENLRLRVVKVSDVARFGSGPALSDKVVRVVQPVHFPRNPLDNNKVGPVQHVDHLDRVDRLGPASHDDDTGEMMGCDDKAVEWVPGWREQKRRGNLEIDEQLPDTPLGREVAAGIRSGKRAGLSVEFRALKDAIVQGVREIRAALVDGAAVVVAPAYDQARAEVRSRRHHRRVLTWL